MAIKLKRTRVKIANAGRPAKKRTQIIVSQAAVARPRPTSSRQTPKRFAGLDEAAQAYARLPNDPCDATLTRPVYMGTGAGYLTRFASEVTLNTDTGIVGFVPGRFGDVASLTNGVIQATAANPSPAVVSWTNQPSPGASFLNGVTDVCRPVAACIEFLYTGPELQRAGTVNKVQLTASDLYSFSGKTFDSCATYFGKDQRMPDGEDEVKFAPGIADQDFSNRYSTWPANASAIAFMYRGMGTSGSVRMRITVVYEWRPQQDDQVVAPPAQGSTSSATTDQVVGALYKADPQWAFKKAAEVGVKAFARYAPMAADYFLPGSGAVMRSFM